MAASLDFSRGPSLAGAVAAFGLPGCPALPDDPIDDRTWAELVARAKHERMEGLLVAATAAGVLAVVDDRLYEVRELGRARARVDLELERETVRVVERLESAAVPYRLLKGPALAHTVYPDPMWRGFGDVDLLVGSDGWFRALSVLNESGARRAVPEIRPDFDLPFGKDATFISVDGWEIDLHRRLVLGPYGFWAAPEDVFACAPATIHLGGAGVNVLQAEHSFVLACYGAVLGDDPPRLAALRDVAQIAFGETTDVEQVFDTAARWNGTDVVARALQLSERRLGVPLRDTPLGRLFGSAAPRGWHRLLMASYRGPGRGYTSQLAGVIALRGVTTKLSYLRALARPQDEYLRARGFTASGFIAHAGSRIRSRR